MKMKQLIVLKIFACVMLMTDHEAQAFYNPSAGRWLNRDPIGEAGFETTRRGASGVMGDGSSLYAFVRNSPVSRIDVYGLSIWKCSRNTEWTWDGGLQHVYLWNDKDNTACGRDGAGVPGLGKAKGVSNPLDKGPGTDKCVKVLNSDGKEDKVMGCCKKPKWKPFPFSDCHDWAENCLEKNSLKDPDIYGRYKGPIDDLKEYCATYPASIACWFLGGGRFP